jgi:hypothetical protein
MSISDLRCGIVKTADADVKRLLPFFRKGFVHLSLDAGTIHNMTVLDMLILRSDIHEGRSMDYLLIESIEVAESTQEFYMQQTARVIEQLMHDGIKIHSIVGDGFSSQFQGLNTLRPNSIQNSEEYIERCPGLRNIFYIYCACHLLNLVLSDALHFSAFMMRCSAAVTSLATLLRKRHYRRLIGRKCPTYSTTHWCHAYLLCCFFARMRQSILNAGVVIPEEILAYGAILEPIYILMCEFEGRHARFYMREKKLAHLYAELDRLAEKFAHRDYFTDLSRLLRAVVFLRFADQNHFLSLIAKSLSDESKMSTDEVLNEPVEPGHYLEGVLEDVLSERAVADLVIDSDEVRGKVEEEDVLELAETAPDDDEWTQDDLEFDRDELLPTLERLENDVAAIKREEADTGIFAIGSALIVDYARRSQWNDQQREKCLEQFLRWVDQSIDEKVMVPARNLSPPAFWIAVGTSCRWAELAEYAEIILSLPASEAENERTFSVRKYIVGDRGGRTQNDLLTARVRLRMVRPRDMASSS